MGSIMKKHLILCAASAITAALFSYTGLTYAEEVGIASATNPDAVGAHASRPNHLLKLGDNILFREKISTDSKGSLQVSFTDGSGMAIGPNATIIIDEYVYDPNKGAAAMSASLVKGALRFVGGAISHDNGVKITVPVATIGVRGGTATLSYSPPKSGSPGILDVIHHYGVTTITTPNDTFTITQQDFKISIGSNGQINQGGLINIVALSDLLKTMTSQNSQTGGAINLPSDALIQGDANSLNISPPNDQGTFDLSLPQAGEAALGAQLCQSPYGCNGF